MAVICSLVCLIAKILDWYNPFMDFTGHIGAIQLILYLVIPVFFLIQPGKKKGI